MKSFISFLTNDVFKEIFCKQNVKNLRPVCILLRPLLHKYKYNFVKLWKKKNLFWPTKQMQKAHKINKLQGSSRLLLVLTSSSLKLHSHFSHHFTWKRIKLLSCIGLHRLKLKSSYILDHYTGSFGDHKNRGIFYLISENLLEWIRLKISLILRLKYCVLI